MKGQRGFTLIELVMGLGLMTVVMAGVLLITTAALRSHFEQIRSGEDSTSELFGIDQMVRTFESTTHFEACYPATNAQASSTGLPVAPPGYCGGVYSYQEVRGCQDYSRAMAPNSVIDGVAANVKWYDFCWSGPGGNGPSGMATLFMYTGTASVCPVGAWPTAGVSCGIPVAGANVNAVMLNAYPVGYPVSQPVFTRNWSGGVDMKFMVGIATSNYSGVGVPSGYKSQAMPVVYRMATGSGTQEGYAGPTCGGAPCD